jgi:hypothetical protein
LLSIKPVWNEVLEEKACTPLCPRAYLPLWESQAEQEMPCWKALAAVALWARWVKWTRSGITELIVELCYQNQGKGKFSDSVADMCLIVTLWNVVGFRKPAWKEFSKCCQTHLEVSISVSGPSQLLGLRASFRQVS